MAGWLSYNPKLTPKAVDGNEMFMGVTPLSQKSAGLDLIQNCDLPPPMKVFTGSGNTTVLAAMSRICSVNSIVEDEYRDGFDRGDGENEKLELLKALRRSQTRAREAEKKAEKMAKEKDRLSNSFLAEANVLFAYRQWVKLLELQVSKIQSQLGGQVNQASCDCGRLKGVKHFSEGGDDGENRDGITWIVALALCFGIAGVGLTFGCRYLY